MKDRELYIEHIKSEANRIQMRRILDKLERVVRNHEIQYTDFLDPYEVKLSESILNRFDLDYFAEGGTENAERRVLCIFPEYIAAADIEKPIAAIKIKGSFKFNSISHRDYLGAIIGTGIKREKLGDIYVSEKSAVLILQREILDYIKLNLTKIGKETVQIEEIEFGDIEIPEQDYDEKVIFVSSPRLDSVISEIYGMSRAKSKATIAAQKVKLNWCLTEDSTSKVSAGDMISVKKLGRSKVLEELGKTKKENQKFKVIIYK